MSNHYILYEEIEYPWISALLASLEESMQPGQMEWAWLLWKAPTREHSPEPCGLGTPGHLSEWPPL